MYASLFGISGALHLDLFEQPEHQVFFGNLPVRGSGNVIPSPPIRTPCVPEKMWDIVRSREREEIWRWTLIRAHESPQT